MKKNYRNFFKSIFSKAKDNVNGTYQAVQMLNNFTPYYYNYSTNKYDNAIVRSCIDKIASQVAKLMPKVVLTQLDKEFVNLEFLLTQKPNEYMNRYDFLYKVVTLCYLNQNSFIYKRIENGKIVGLYPINYANVEFVEYQNELFCEFSFRTNSFKVTLPYQELIHLRRFYAENDLFGSSNDDALRPILNVIQASNDGMINAVNVSGQLRGLLKYSGVIQPEDLQARKQEFVRGYMNLNGNFDGIGALDSKFEFQPINLSPYTLDSEQQQLAIDNVCRLFGVSESILKGNFKEDEYNSFYNLVVEPFAMQLSLELTNKIFTQNQINKGNKIILSADKMTFANNSTKATMCREMLQLGVFSINEARSIFELEPIEDGDTHRVSLNYVDLNKANEYQLGVKEDDNENEE